MPAPLIAALLPWLAEQGLGLLKGAVEAKGKEVVEGIIGVKLPEKKEDLTPELAYKLRELEFSHEEKLLEIGIEHKKLDYAEMANARDREARINESENASWLSKNVTSIIALTIIVGGLSTLNWHPDPEVRLVVGNLMMLVLGYYFGTSMGSTKANQILRDQVKGK